MNELADFSKEQLMTSREISVLTGKQHRHVVRDIDNLNESYVKLDMPKVGHIYYSDTMNRQQKAYNLTKIQTFDLMTGYSAELRIKVNRRWEELESKQLDFNDPDTVLRLVQSWKMEKERRIELSEDNKIKEQVIIGKNRQLHEQEPKVEYHDNVLASKEAHNVTTLAKTFNMSAKKLNQFLYEQKVQFRTDHKKHYNKTTKKWVDSFVWVPYSKYQAEGYCKVNTISILLEDGTKRSQKILVWTEKGQRFIYDLLKKHSKINPDQELNFQ